MGFDIDWQSAGIGYGAGLLTGYAIYQSRHVIGAIRNTFSSQVDSAQSFATMGGDRRYVNELTKYANKAHLFHDAVELSDILIEPRFIPDRELAISVEEDEALRKPFEVVPLIPDHPYLHQPYNINTITIKELGYGDRAIALLGLPGSGRTTALLSIALWSMGKIEFSRPHDPVEERIAEEEKELPREEREERAKTRVAIEQRAREQLREDLGIDMSEISPASFVPPFRRLAPLYIHLANVRLSSRSWRGEVDPAEPLIRALQYQTGNITSKTIPRKIYRFLDEGLCLLLLDGFDELPLAEQRQKTAWLHALLDEYNQNFIIVTGPACGYGGLQEVGLTPVHLRPWNHQDNEMYIDKLTTQWSDITGQRRFDIDEDQKADLLDDIWGLNPFETTMKLRSQLANDEHDPDFNDYTDWTRHYIANQFDDADDAMAMMANAAELQLDHHFFTLNDWVDIEIALALEKPLPADFDVEAEFPIEDTDAAEDFDEFDEFDSPSPTFAEEFEQELEDPFDTDNAEDEDFSMFEADDMVEGDDFEETEASEEEVKDETKEARQVRRSVNKLLSTMLKSGLIERYRGNRYRFRQSYIASYLASLNLVQAGNEGLTQKANQPDWLQAIAYASSSMDITDAAETKMSNRTDVLYSNILDVVQWLRYSDELVEWRNKYLNYLGQMFVAPSQYRSGRERIAAALVTTRDPVIRKIFGRGTQHANSDVRKLSILALGVFQDESMMDNLSAFFTDANDDVRVAAALAIGNIHTEEADTLLTTELFDTQSERVQQAITETFADKPAVGYEILWELLNDEAYQEMLRVRRAAVYGVKRLRTQWSLEELYRTYLNEQQWFVKSTAQSAFTERQSQRNKGVHAYPQIITLPWLREWSQSLEDEQAIEASGVELLNMAMREPQAVIRFLATATSGQLGVYQNIPDLYQLLNDQEAAIRDTAYRALTDLQLRMGEPLPLAT